MIRHMYGLSADKDAVYFDPNLDWVSEIEHYILKHVEEINSLVGFEYADEAESIRNEMMQFWAEWKERIELAHHDRFYYGDRFIVNPPTGHEKRLLKVFGSGGGDVARETLTSMRTVDKSILSNFPVWSEEV